MQKSTWLGLIVLAVIGVAVFFGLRGDTYPQFVQTKLNQPITAIEIQPYVSDLKEVAMVRIENPKTLRNVDEWLKNIKKADTFVSGADPVCKMDLHMEDGTTICMKISPPVLKHLGIVIPDTVNAISISWDGYRRSGENVFQDFFTHYRFRKPSSPNSSSDE
jgi:hypothetical protein